MTIQKIREHHQADPFKPFYLRLSDGRKLLVRHRENLGYSLRGRSLSVFDSPDAGDLIDVDDVIRIEPAKVRTSKGNGR